MGGERTYIEDSAVLAGEAGVDTFSRHFGCRRLRKDTKKGQGYGTGEKRKRTRSFEEGPPIPRPAGPSHAITCLDLFTAHSTHQSLTSHSLRPHFIIVTGRYQSIPFVTRQLQDTEPRGGRREAARNNSQPGTTQTWTKEENGT